jgi:uncharacterized protein YprB with RNaseH-like and TPR domain
MRRAVTQEGAPPGPRTTLGALIPPRATTLGPLHVKSVQSFSCAPLERGALEALALGDVELDVRRPLFLDTETTGLAGGTGTLAFLIGIATVHEQGGAVIEQAHLPAPGQERPMLQWLRERLEDATCLITFNGKSFDWPLLRSRYVMNRLTPPPERTHLDLLHCARRVLRYQLEHTQLGTLERAVLGVHRVNDLDGALIPAVWFDYLRTGRVATLGRVLEHNERDVRSMVELVEWLTDAWEGRREVSAEARLGLAVVAARLGDDERALRWAPEAPGRCGALANELKAGVLRRRGDVRGAVASLAAALEASPSPARVHLRLAKLYEHQLKDPHQALLHAPKARDAESLEANTRRQSRLTRRTSQPG